MTEEKPPETDWLDACLDSVPDELPSATLRRQVAEIPLRHARAAEPGFLQRWLPWRAFTAAALACALGVVSGTFIGADSSDDEGFDDVTSVAFALGLDEEP